MQKWAEINGKWQGCDGCGKFASFTVSTQATYSIIRTAKQLMALYLHILDVLKRFMKISRNKIIIEIFPIIYMDW